VKELRKSVDIWLSYGQRYSDLFLTHGVECAHTKLGLRDVAMQRQPALMTLCLEMSRRRGGEFPGGIYMPLGRPLILIDNRENLFGDRCRRRGRLHPTLVHTTSVCVWLSGRH